MRFYILTAALMLPFMLNSESKPASDDTGRSLENALLIARAKHAEYRVTLDLLERRAKAHAPVSAGRYATCSIWTCSTPKSLSIPFLLVCDTHRFHLPSQSFVSAAPQ